MLCFFVSYTLLRVPSNLAIMEYPSPGKNPSRAALSARVGQTVTIGTFS